MKKEQHLENEPQIATGIDDDEELSQKATKEEIERGDYTRVVSLRYDEDPRL
ncbi:MAG: hypothetical protein LPK26_08430 [Bacillaceae bacterium]|uniref:Uncharacterized protein n=1 Tax=Alkalihalobacterium chitinilyticum TaxID=2980103 RepID=A0ABT5VH42_9BACI|nr:hypothetical protein [Alkalihalobacterium chitinilyticum]MDE5413534.1 hypothetical protein [Alkalihalobacterium chitinilyticum]MEB1807314.1 hypothetical protein [Bacillaceae bacterium]